MNKPQYTRTLSGHSFYWPEISIRINMDKVDNDGKGEFWCWHSNGEGDKLLHLSNHNLLSTTSTKQLIERLNKNNAEIDWNTALTYVSAMTLTENRRGNPLQQLGEKPNYLKIDYQLRPILEKHQPTTLYAPGSSGKSYIADLIAVAVQYNVCVLDWIPETGNVLYLDQESSHNDHSRRVWAIKNGLKKKGCTIDDSEKIQYRFCTQPLVADLTAIQQLVFDNHISLVIIDSMMAFEEGMPDSAQRASRFYNALRSLECTTLTIDHVSKAEWKADDSQNPIGAYGSVVKYNRSRSIFELKKSQESGEDTIEVALIHRKHNEGRLLKPIGLKIQFENDNDDVVQSVSFERCDLSGNVDLSKNLTARQRIIELLKKSGKKLSIEEIAEDTGIDKNQVKARLNDRKGKDFGKGDDERWFLLAYT